MKTNVVKTVSVAALFAGLAMIPSAANASLEVFTWNPDTTLPLPVDFISSSGTLEYDTVTGNISDFSFTYDHLGTDNTYDAYTGTVVLGDGDLALNGFSYNSHALFGIPDLNWVPTGQPQPDENSATPVLTIATIFGDWVPESQPASVPEPTTVFAGAMLLLPLGLGAVRSLRKNRNA